MNPTQPNQRLLRSTLCAFGSLLMAAVASGEPITKEVSDSFPAEPNGRLILSLPAGNVTVRSHEALEVRYTATLTATESSRSQAQEQFERMRIDASRHGADTRVEFKAAERGALRFLSGGKELPALDVVVFVPESHSLVIDSTSGSIEVESVNGDHVIDATSASVRASGCEGSFRIDLTSGSVALGDLNGEIRIDTTSGQAEVQNSRGTLAFDSTSGSLTALGFLGDIRADTTSGSIRASLPSAEFNLIEADSTSGSVEIDIPDDADVAIELDSNSGSIDVAFPLSEVTYRTKHELRATKGDGSRRIVVDTTSGSIRIL